MNRALWDVWFDGKLWMVQLQKRRLGFESEKSAREAAQLGAALAAEAALKALAAKLTGRIQ